MPEIRRLLALAETPEACCREVDAMLDQHIERIRQQRRSLAKLEKEMVALRRDCHPSQQVQGCGILRDSSLVRKVDI